LSSPSTAQPFTPYVPFPFIPPPQKLVTLTYLPPKQCVDITFVEPGDPRLPEVNETNCFNSSDIGLADIYTLTLRASGQNNASSGATRTLALNGNAMAYLGYLPVVLGGLWALL
jgi:hypothetical protein